jgi:hypothetical protein
VGNIENWFEGFLFTLGGDLKDGFLVTLKDGCFSTFLEE